MLEDPTLDEIPGFPGTTKNNYNMNCTNQTDPTNTTLLTDCQCQDYNSGDFYVCVNETHVDYLYNTTQQYDENGEPVERTENFENKTYIDYANATYEVPVPY